MQYSQIHSKATTFIFYTWLQFIKNFIKNLCAIKLSHFSYPVRFRLQLWQPFLSFTLWIFFNVWKQLHGMKPEL